jgi:GT2 family glycosyltransferase
MSARYRPVPEAVGVDEKVLTSANVFVRRSVLERVGGFDERLFPNEETEMFARAKDAGVVMAYTPELRVRHRRAGSLAAFCLQFFRSGRGRVRQGRVRGRRPEAVYFLPLLLLVYLGSLPVLLLAKAPQAVSLPAAAYALAAVATAAAAAVEHREPAAALALPVLFLALHLSYAAGTLAGLLEWALGGWPGNPF